MHFVMNPLPVSQLTAGRFLLDYSVSVGSETLPILIHVAVKVSKRAANPLLQNLPWPKTASLVIFLLFLKFPYFKISHRITEASDKELYGTQT